MKKIILITFSILLGSMIQAQKIAKAGAFKKFLKSNQGVTLYFHHPFTAEIKEGHIASWDWENYTIELTSKGYKKIGKIKYPEFQKNASKPAKSVIAFSICLNDRVITPVLAVKDTIPLDAEFPYFEMKEWKKNKRTLVISPSNGNFEDKMNVCFETQKTMIELGKTDPYERLAVMDLFRGNKQVCKEVLIPHLMLYDRDLYLYLESKGKLAKNGSTEEEDEIEEDPESSTTDGENEDTEEDTSDSEKPEQPKSEEKK